MSDTVTWCGWCDENTPVRRCADCRREKCDMCGRCEPCIHGTAVDEPFLVLAAAYLTREAMVRSIDRIPDPEAQALLAAHVWPFLGLAEIARSFVSLAVLWTAWMRIMVP